MIRSSIVWKGATLALAIGVHGGLAVSLSSKTIVEIESDAGAQTAMLGNSFADLSAGVLVPSQAKAKLEPVEPIETKPVDPSQFQKAKQITNNITQRNVLSAQPKTIEIAYVAPRKVTLRPTLETVTSDVSKHRQQRLQSTTLTTHQQAAMSQPSYESTPAKALKPQKAIKAEEGEATTSVTRSPRPQKRSVELENRAAVAKPKPKLKTKAGNAKRNAKAGSSNGSKKARSKKQGRKTGATKRTGNAAASNYPGRVMARISSAGRPSVNVRGTAVVRFTINARGGLSSAGVVRSSGSRRLDNAAVQVIHNAIPFPRPPAGARRTFSINVQGR